LPSRRWTDPQKVCAGFAVAKGPPLARRPFFLVSGGSICAKKKDNLIQFSSSWRKYSKTDLSVSAPAGRDEKTVSPLASHFKPR
jgi:hypothetical protein